ncbi:MAG: hypothetical protein NVSMB10_18330 [Steroidobacteraceae bacterium]
MAAGLPDLVDCAHLAAEVAAFEREYELVDLPRIRTMMAESRGTLRARFAFSRMPSGHPGATVSVQAAPWLVCQRCMQAFPLEIAAASAVEFATAADVADSERELYPMTGGYVSLREMAEEELLLALPIAPACSSPSTCGKVPRQVAVAARDGLGEMRRPFEGLQDLMKK